MENLQDQIETLLKEVSEQAEEIKRANIRFDELKEMYQNKCDEGEELEGKLEGIVDHIDEIKNIL